MTALNGEDKTRIRETLAKFTANVEDNMLRYYATFLTTYPNYINMFASLKGLSADPDKLLRNEWLRAQGPRFAAAIVDLVENIENYDALQASISRLVLAPRHTKHDLKTDDYMNALNIFVQNMKTVLAEQMFKSDVESWQRFLARLKLIIDVELKKLNKQHASLTMTYSMPF